MEAEVLEVRRRRVTAVIACAVFRWVRDTVVERWYTYVHGVIVACATEGSESAEKRGRFGRIDYWDVKMLAS